MAKILLIACIAVSALAFAWAQAQVVTRAARTTWAPPRGIKGEGIAFKLSAINLPGLDLTRYSDPYVEAYVKDSFFRGFEKFGETAVSRWTRDPDWSETFHFKYLNGTNQRWRFIVRDYDIGWNADEKLGSVEVNVEDIVHELRKVSPDGSLRTATEPLKLFLNNPKGGVLILKPVPSP